MSYAPSIGDVWLVLNLGYNIYKRIGHGEHIKSLRDLQESLRFIIFELERTQSARRDPYGRFANCSEARRRHTYHFIKSTERLFRDFERFLKRHHIGPRHRISPRARAVSTLRMATIDSGTVQEFERKLNLVIGKIGLMRSSVPSSSFRDLLADADARGPSVITGRREVSGYVDYGSDFTPRMEDLPSDDDLSSIYSTESDRRLDVEEIELLNDSSGDEQSGPVVEEVVYERGRGNPNAAREEYNREREIIEEVCVSRAAPEPEECVLEESTSEPESVSSDERGVVEILERTGHPRSRGPTRFRRIFGQPWRWGL